ncbi:MAG: hypothetical protein NTX85_01730 [Candidatus Nomurabacteria bacterium]|nr:hypothetical protein [Candidatus Nomurabacteria bacterium]
MSKTRDILTSPRVEEIKRTKRKANIRLSVLFFVLFIVLVAGLSFLSNYKKMTINIIVVNGTRIINQSDVQDFVEGKMSGKYLYMFNRHNAFIYPHDTIYDGLLKKFTRIEKLSLNVKNVNTLEIYIKERSGSYMWCGDKVPVNEEEKGENCYFINDDGYIFDNAPYVSGNLYFKYYLPLANAENILGSQMLSPEIFHNTIRLSDTIRESGLDPIMITEDADYWYVHLNHRESATSPYIIFRKDSDLDKVGEDIKLSMNQKEFRDEINGKYDTLLYIDMRFKNKVFYKFQ